MKIHEDCKNCDSTVIKSDHKFNHRSDIISQVLRQKNIFFSHFFFKPFQRMQNIYFCFSCADRDSFTTVEEWKRRVQNECGEIPMG